MNTMLIAVKLCAEVKCSTGSWWTWWTQQMKPISALFLWKGRRVKVGIPMICVSPSSGSTVTHRSAFPAVLLFEQIKNNIFLNQIRNYCSFFLSFLSWWKADLILDLNHSAAQRQQPHSTSRELGSKAVLLLSKFLWVPLTLLCLWQQEK